MLQWGRAFSGTEIAVCKNYSAGKDELQWGRAFSGTEIISMSLAKSLWGGLQWGRAFSGTEIIRAKYNDKDYGSFNGAVPFQARK